MDSEAWRLSSRRNGMRAYTDALLRTSLLLGEHAHLLDEDGNWCLDGTCTPKPVKPPVIWFDEPFEG